jgi:hypothetical protein
MAEVLKTYKIIKAVSFNPLEQIHPLIGREVPIFEKISKSASLFRCYVQIFYLWPVGSGFETLNQPLCIVLKEFFFARVRLYMNPLP